MAEWKPLISHRPRAWSGVFLIVIAIGMVSCAVECAGCHAEQSCTVTYQTEKKLTGEDGALVIDARDIKTLNCSTVWVGEGE